MKKLLDRRKALISGTGLALGLAAAHSAALATPMLSSPQSELMPRGTQRRVVVVGGGWGGLDRKSTRLNSSHT